MERKKKGFFGISKELQCGVCNCDESCASSCKAKEGKHFYRGGKGSWGTIVNKVHGFSLTESLRRKKEESSFLSGSGMAAKYDSSPFWCADSTELKFLCACSVLSNSL